MIWAAHHRRCHRRSEICGRGTSRQADESAAEVVLVVNRDGGLVPHGQTDKLRAAPQRAGRPLATLPSCLAWGEPVAHPAEQWGGPQLRPSEAERLRGFTCIRDNSQPGGGHDYVHGDILFSLFLFPWIGLGPLQNLDIGDGGPLDD